MIRKMIHSDSSRVLDIYKMGIETRNATFETIIPVWNIWNSKHLKHSRFVFEKNGNVLGWVALSQVSARNVYRGIAEVSIYIDLDHFNKGIGTLLMEEAIKSSENNGIWTLQSSVFPENEATLKLHKKFGFRIVGKREKIASLDGIWRDTIILERRSKVVGV
ncbi:MAG: N-acetyltransferase family protein [Tenuifilaceae bacterium]